MPRPTQDLTGQRFGRLTVLERDYETKTRHANWRCLCDCENEVTMPSISLRSGNTKSCGCLHREVVVARNKTHGLSGTPTYYSWNNMIRRTTHENDPRYPEWGGRGIKVCDRWREYPNFLADMGERPPGTTLDRINNDGNYEKDNCRWATPLEQFENSSLQRDPATGRWASPML